jgi:hypothetical protein
MAAHTQSTVVSWGGNDNIVSPVLSSASSIVSIDSILSHKRHTTTSAFGEGAPPPESLARRMSSLSVEPSGTLISASTYPSADPVGDSFIRHHKYFFKDGNVTFLVRGSQP